MFEFKLQKQINTNFQIDVEFKAQAGEITTLIGKSGAGKSTILNLITGLIPLDVGFVRSNQKEYTQIPIHLRQFGYLQQKSHLFPHLSVVENLMYSGKDKNLEPFLDIFELKPHLHKKVQQLSGGESQRVALVRTLMSQPQLLLLDESFSALDTKLRTKLRTYLKTLNLPILFITHDLEEAYEISDQILVIDNGKIIEQGRCKTIFHECYQLRTAQLINIKNIYSARYHKNELWIEKFKCQGDKPGKKFRWVAIIGNQISLEKDGYPATIQQYIYKLDNVLIKLAVSGLSHPLEVVLSLREFEPWQNKREVHFKIHSLIYLEDNCD